MSRATRVALVIASTALVIAVVALVLPALGLNPLDALGIIRVK